MVATSEEDNFLKLPDLSSVQFNHDSAYTYMCSNNTIFGTQFKSFPTNAPSPLVADMSSDILSREFNVADFGIIFAGSDHCELFLCSFYVFCLTYPPVLRTKYIVIVPTGYYPASLF